MATWAACILLLVQGAAVAAGDERAAIAEGRRSVEARFKAQQEACRDRFAVTACLDEARARRRTELAPWRERELQLDDAERRARAEERRAAIVAKQAAAASRPAASAPVPAVPRAERVAASAPTPQRHRDTAHPASRDAAEAAQRAKAAERRREAARQTQERVARRLAEKSAQGRRAEPLPAPAAAASGSR